MTGIPPTLSLADIEGHAKNYRFARDLLGSRVTRLMDDIAKLRKEAEPMIRSALQTAKAAEAELSAAIQANPQHFRRPKTLIFHGVKIGFEKGKGKVSIDDPAKTIELIRANFEKKRQMLLIKVKETPIKKAISQLTGVELKSIGVSVGEGGDFVIVRPVDSELEKALDALLKPESVEAAAADDDRDDE